jgi:hypothetical protein
MCMSESRLSVVMSASLPRVHRQKLGLTLKIKGAPRGAASGWVRDAFVKSCVKNAASLESTRANVADTLEISGLTIEAGVDSVDTVTLALMEVRWRELN